MALTQKQLATLKDKIQAERERILNSFDHINMEELHLNNDDRFDEVDKALKKFESDEYGICEDCDETIKFERLMARPTAELCISCKDEAEREEQGSFIGRQSKSLGQSGGAVKSL